MLSQSRLKHLLHYDPGTGVFTWLVDRRGTAKAGSTAGSVQVTGYRAISVDRKIYRASHLAWLYMTGAWPRAFIDHRDTDPTNDRWSNLREATQVENVQNVIRPRRDSTSGVKGVNWHRKDGKWRARISVAGRQKFLGNFDTAEEAHAAYVAAKKLYHPFATIGEDQ